MSRFRKLSQTIWYCRPECALHGARILDAEWKRFLPQPPQQPLLCSGLHKRCPVPELGSAGSLQKNGDMLQPGRLPQGADIGRGLLAGTVLKISRMWEWKGFPGKEAIHGFRPNGPFQGRQADPLQVCGPHLRCAQSPSAQAIPPFEPLPDHQGADAVDDFQEGWRFEAGRGAHEGSGGAPCGGYGTADITVLV